MSDAIVCPVCKGDKVIRTEAKRGTFEVGCLKCLGKGTVRAPQVLNSKDK